ncbi:hypothetical protein YC2023_085879 [Brassica napus]
MVGVLNIFIGDESFKVLDSIIQNEFLIYEGLMYPSVCVVSWMGLNKVFEAVMYPSWFFPWMHLEPLLIHHTSDGLNLVISPLSLFFIYGMPYEYSVYISSYLAMDVGTYRMCVSFDSKHIQPCPFDVNVYCSKSITSFLPPLSLASDSPIT